MIVRYYDDIVKAIKTGMLELIAIESSSEVVRGSTGENHYQSLINTLRNYQIAICNFIGFTADEASNIMGDHNSPCSRLKKGFSLVPMNFKVQCKSS